jgi:L-lactate utilization protein LutB
MAFTSSSFRLTLIALTASSTSTLRTPCSSSSLEGGRCDVACPVEIPISGILGDLKRRYIGEA